MTGLLGIQLALNKLYLTFSAGSIAGAGGVNHHIGFPGRLKQVFSQGCGHRYLIAVLESKYYICHSKFPPFLVP